MTHTSQAPARLPKPAHATGSAESATTTEAPSYTAGKSAAPEVVAAGVLPTPTEAMEPRADVDDGRRRMTTEAVLGEP
jgi:hypothetical protein